MGGKLDKKNINRKFVSFQSLNGGMPIGFEQVFNLPGCHITTQSFLDSHDKYYIEYCKQRGYNIPIILLNDTFDGFKSENDEKLFDEYVKNNEIDVVCIVPPCAGLSMLNCSNNKDSSKCRGDADNDQNQNMYNTVEFSLNKIKPKVAVFENAPTAYTALGVGVIEKLKQIAINNGYSITLEKTTTSLHGIPQNRERTFVYFWKGDKSYYINYEQKEMPLLADYLKLIPIDAKGNNIYAKEIDTIKDYSYKFLKHKYKFEKFFDLNKEFDFNTISGNQVIDKLNLYDEAVEYFETTSDFANEKERAKAIRIMKKNKQKIADGKGYWDDSCVVFNKNESINALISKYLFRIIHPTEERSLNVRELLWLMGLPHDYWMEDLPKSWAKITQSVPVATAAHVAKNCLQFINNELKLSNGSFVKQSNIKKQIDLVENIKKDEESSLGDI